MGFVSIVCNLNLTTGKEKYFTQTLLIYRSFTPMRYRNIYCLLLLSLLLACKEQIKKPKEAKPYNTVMGSWQFADVEFPDSAKRPQLSRSLRSYIESGAFHNQLLFSFFPDSVFSVTGRTGYSATKWYYADRKQAVNLIDTAGKPQMLFIKHSLKNDQQVLGMIVPGERVQLKFNLYADSLVDFHKDPFYPPNNLWRKPPAHPETDAELQKRLANYFLHLLYILQSALERNQQEVTFEFSPGIVKIYAGGIGVEDWEQVPPYWLKTFYNPAQAKAAYTMYYTYMHRTPFYGKGTGNWLKDDHMLLQNIYNDMQSGKFIDVKEGK